MERLKIKWTGYDRLVVEIDHDFVKNTCDRVNVGRHVLSNASDLHAMWRNSIALVSVFDEVELFVNSLQATSLKIIIVLKYLLIRVWKGTASSNQNNTKNDILARYIAAENPTEFTATIERQPISDVSVD